MEVEGNKAGNTIKIRAECALENLRSARIFNIQLRFQVDKVRSDDR